MALSLVACCSFNSTLKLSHVLGAECTVWLVAGFEAPVIRQARRHAFG